VTLPHPELGDAWRAARPPAAGVHLDSAASGRQSVRVLDAAATHARHEAEIGAYVAEAAAAPLLRQGRAAIGALLARAADDVAFVESAQTALVTLLACWPLSPGDAVVALPGEYGPNLAAFEARGLRVVDMPVDGQGRADVEGLERVLRDGPDLVHLTHVGAHRGLVQPAHAVAAACRQAGVPLILDAAQSLGHVDTEIDCDAVYATSRKWLAGPRGVGILAVRPDAAARLRPAPPALGPQWWPGDVPPAQRLESREAHVAGRVALCLAVGEHLAAGPDRIRARLTGIGRATRAAVEGAGGWRVVEPAGEPSAITTLAAPPGVDVAATRARLLAECGVLTTYGGPERAPREMTGPVLRVSPHVDATVEDLEALAAALAEVAGS